ncbi:MAG: molecular chaperone DnaK, partial [Polyangiales bacterium]
KDKLPADDVVKLEALLKDGRSAVEKQDDAAIQDVTAKLEKESHRIAEAVYKAAGAAGGDGANGGNGGAGPTEGGGAAPPAGGKKKDGVIDAEFEESP